MSVKRIAALFASGALAACNLAPNYVRPEAPVPAQWNDTDAAKGARRAAELDWREFFPDERLRALISAALDNNRDLRIATARVAEARALYGVQRADRLPTVNLAADRNAARTPADLSLAGRAMTTQRYDVDLGLLSFELDFWGRVRNLSDAALASYLSTEEAQRAARLALISTVADTYLGVQELSEREAIARDTLQGRQESFDLVARRREVGVAGDLDYYLAQAILETARVDLANLERQRSAAENALRVVVGHMPENLPPGRKLTDQGIVNDLSAGLPSEVLLARPDVLAAEQALIGANANIGAARAAFLPRINLTGTFGTASGALGNLFKAGQKAWTFQPTLSEPLFDAGRTGAGVDLAQARKVIAVAQYEKTLQQAFREVADLLAARQKLAEQLKAQELVETAQGERLRLTDARYQGGVASHLELLDAQRDAFTARQATVQARRQLLSAAAQLYAALGGGGELPAAAGTAKRDAGT
jgi:multidrug efflux system outer membrane protein